MLEQVIGQMPAVFGVEIVSRHSGTDPDLSAEPAADEPVVKVKVQILLVANEAVKQEIHQVRLIQILIRSDIRPENPHDRSKVTALHKLPPLVNFRAIPAQCVSGRILVDLG